MTSDTSRVTALIDKALDLRLLRLHAERLADIALTEPEPRAPADPLADMADRTERAPAAIEVRDLRFQYGVNEAWILDGLSFRIEAGESVAIVGPSGCGKTTLLRILSSLREPTSGEVLIGGRPLTLAGVEAYRSMIGVVMQDDQLFAGSIADNISFFAENPSQKRIRECARQAAIHDDIVAMPMGYHTLIGDMGTVLSGGQKQRVLIARALYNEPAILLMDEATSHLDIAREKAVNAAIRSTSMTRVIVAHRRETILSADRIIVLGKGQITDDLRTSESKESLLRSADIFNQVAGVEASRLASNS